MNGVLDRRKAAAVSLAHKADGSTRMTDSEEHTLRKKVQIKTQALLMLSQELEQCRTQRDRYKLVAEQLQEDLDRRKHETDKAKVINGFRQPTDISSYRLQPVEKCKVASVEEETKIVDMLIEAREQNKCFRLQVDTLRQKYKEAQEDIKALRSKKETPSPVNQVTPAMHQREEMIEQLESFNVKYKQLKSDLQSVLDEKQELEMERDAFKCKAHRLNHELAQALGAAKPVDVDALVNENRYLQERLQQLLEEKDLAQQSVQKYKSMLDSKRQKGIIKLGGKSSVGSVMTFKQVEQLLQQGPNLPPQKATAALSELHSICTALLESLNDKNLALAHQKKANKILAARMCELDKTIGSPTNRLLEGYSSADVDIRCDSTSMTSDLSEERSDDKVSDLQCDESFVEQDIKCKHSDESSIEQSVASKLSNECLTEIIDSKDSDECSIDKIVECEKSSESVDELKEKSCFKPFVYQYNDPTEKKEDYENYENIEKQVLSSLSEHKKLEEEEKPAVLEAKDEEKS